MKKLLCAFCLLAASTVHADEWLYIDVIVCEDAPAAIEWRVLYVKISVWTGVNTVAITDVLNPTLGGSGIYKSDHYLPGTVNLWNAWIWPGKQRMYGYDGKYYQVRWMDVAAYGNDVSNYSTMHLNFDWRIDPDQSQKPNETTALRRIQWQEAW